MTRADPLQCTYDDARRAHLRDGIAMSTSAKVAFFEAMVTLAVRFGARDRLADRTATAASQPAPSSAKSTSPR